MAIVQTVNGFLITYNILVDPQARVFQHVYQGNTLPRSSNAQRHTLEDERRGFREVNIRFRMVVRIDAGIVQVLALDDVLVVATKKPAAVQCIKWVAEKGTSQTTTELLSRMSWIPKKSNVNEMVYDRAMCLAIWLTEDGDAFAVQRLSAQPNEPAESTGSQRLFNGYGFHTSTSTEDRAIKATINARFSLLAIGCSNGDIQIHTAKDYAGNIPLSHTPQSPASFSITGEITNMSYSPDGYCLFIGYQNGWATWSVYGKLGATSFGSGSSATSEPTQGWLGGIADSAWLTGGSDLLFLSPNDNQLWILEMARSAVTSCHSAANVAHTFLLTNTHLMVHRGQAAGMLDITSSDGSPWQYVQIPALYLSSQKPIRCAVISPDGRYIAVAGRRGLAHFSLNSGRWKLFDDFEAENSFVVRGGMCWYQHILVAAVETEGHHEVRSVTSLMGRTDILPDTALLSGVCFEHPGSALHGTASRIHRNHFAGRPRFLTCIYL